MTDSTGIKAGATAPAIGVTHIETVPPGKSEAIPEELVDAEHVGGQRQRGRAEVHRRGIEHVQHGEDVR
ncbi:hypothetical protein BBK82_44055 [Lentzea guizhouensis]|uniref:Uncharacterized protein n=1 Tax=Lentzea guizhouensis TaxID=1586287 RepID=A0A1B2HW02_9PSEU|nr:hypothetical protein [Lentzea guizhouensis]ANZ41878.1 hypothetical protein BBK82_44055 [Lentzea guizhouensis]